jgi:hypothetical protein
VARGVVRGVFAAGWFVGAFAPQPATVWVEVEHADPDAQAVREVCTVRRCCELVVHAGERRGRMLQVATDTSLQLVLQGGERLELGGYISAGMEGHVVARLEGGRVHLETFDVTVTRAACRARGA